MKRYIRAELLDHYRVTNYKGYDIVRLLYGHAYNEDGHYDTYDENEVFSIGYDKHAPEFETLEEAKQYIDNLL